MTTTLEKSGDGELAVPAESAADRHHRLRWVILGVLGLAQLMVVLDATIVNIALPHAQTALQFGDATGSGSSPPMPSPSAACCYSAAASPTCWAGGPPSSSAS